MERDLAAESPDDQEVDFLVLRILDDNKNATLDLLRQVYGLGSPSPSLNA